MSLALSILLVSFVSMMVMLHLKLLELSHGKHFVFSKIRHAADIVIHEKRATVKSIFGRVNRENIARLLVPVMLFLMKMIERVRHFFYIRFEKMILLVKGKGS